MGLEISLANRLFNVPYATLYSVNLGCDKTFYRNPDTNQSLRFVFIFFDASGFADPIDGTLLAAHELSMTLELFHESSFSVIIFFNLSI